MGETDTYEQIGSVTYSVDGCSVPTWTHSGFPPGLFIRHLGDPTTNPLAEIFFEACRGHDLCYQTCGSDQGQCDSALYNDILAECNRQIPPNRPGTGWEGSPNAEVPFIQSLLLECRQEAGKVYAGVFAFGALAHYQRQGEMCVACPK